MPLLKKKPTSTDFYSMTILIFFLMSYVLFYVVKQCLLKFFSSKPGLKKQLVYRVIFFTEIHIFVEWHSDCNSFC